MKSTDDMNVLTRAIETYGKDMQTIVAIEEMAELQKELTKALRGRPNIENIIEEMADVYIMLVQIRLMYDIDINEIVNNETIKIWRLRERLKRSTTLRDKI